MNNPHLGNNSSLNIFFLLTNDNGMKELYIRSAHDIHRMPDMELENVPNNPTRLPTEMEEKIKCEHVFNDEETKVTQELSGDEIPTIKQTCIKCGIIVVST